MSMVERVARVLAGLPIANDGRRLEAKWWDADVCAAARAAIAAMREPTDAMMKKGIGAGWGNDFGEEDEDEMRYARDLWRDMIDAALAE